MRIAFAEDRRFTEPHADGEIFCATRDHDRASIIRRREKRFECNFISVIVAMIGSGQHAMGRESKQMRSGIDRRENQSRRQNC